MVLGYPDNSEVQPDLKTTRRNPSFCREETEQRAVMCVWSLNTIILFYVSTWLGCGVPSYLLKHYSGCFGMILILKLVDRVKPSNIWTYHIQTGWFPPQIRGNFSSHLNAFKLGHRLFPAFRLELKHQLPLTIRPKGLRTKSIPWALLVVSPLCLDGNHTITLLDLWLTGCSYWNSSASINAWSKSYYKSLYTFYWVCFSAESWLISGL